MKTRYYLIMVLVLSLAAACQPEETQPVFTTTYSLATPIPLPTTRPKVAATLSGRIRSFSISPDMRTIALATSKGVIIYDLKTYDRLQTLNESESFYLADWSPDGKKLSAGGLLMASSEIGRSHLIVWDASAWQIIFEQTGKDDTLTSIYGDIAWSPDSRSLADSINGMGVLVHNIQSGEVISSQETLAAHSISWSPNGTRLVATGDLASAIRRWKVSTDQSVRLFDERAGSFMQIEWSPEGSRIASGSAEGAVCIWTAVTNKCDGFIQKAHQHTVFSLAWSPDGSQLATGGGVVRIWDSYTGKVIRSFGMSDTSVYTHLDWLAMVHTLISAEIGYAEGAPTMVRFWDVDTGKILFEFHGASASWGE